MATDMQIVITNDIGNTIKLGAIEPNKYDVDISALGLSTVLMAVNLDGDDLVFSSKAGEVRVDLTPILPTIAADVFLKSVTRQDNKLVFVVGEQASTANDTTFEIDVADLLPVQADGVSITGTGVTADKLKVQISASTSGNLLKQTADGLYVVNTDVQGVWQIEPRTVRVTNASGTSVLGFIHDGAVTTTTPTPPTTLPPLEVIYRDVTVSGTSLSTEFGGEYPAVLFGNILSEFPELVPLSEFKLQRPFGEEWEDAPEYDPSLVGYDTFFYDGTIYALPTASFETPFRIVRIADGAIAGQGTFIGDITVEGL